MHHLYPHVQPHFSPPHHACPHPHPHPGQLFPIVLNKQHLDKTLPLLCALIVQLRLRLTFPYNARFGLAFPEIAGCKIASYIFKVEMGIASFKRIVQLRLRLTFPNTETKMFVSD